MFIIVVSVSWLLIPFARFIDSHTRKNVDERTKIMIMKKKRGEEERFLCRSTYEVYTPRKNFVAENAGEELN